MAFGVFVHRADSGYEDDPSRQYQFPSIYYSRAKKFEGDWIVYYEPTKVRGTKGYFAVARLERIIPDPTRQGMFRALIEPDTYLEFPSPVPYIAADGITETGLLNAAGKNSGRAQSAVRELSAHDFRRILSLGLADTDDLLPRVNQEEWSANEPLYQIDEEQAEFGERVRVESLTSRVLRDRAFRRLVLRAYDERCAVTGLKLINGGGRAEVEAAHIWPVEAGGPDRLRNGVTLSGTVHWMFDRGLITFSDELDIIVSRHVNDRDGVESLINRTGKLIGPLDPRDRPHPMFLAWHRENRFKA
jgi:putative restriction endonuclease